MTSISNIWKQLISIFSNLNNFHSLEIVDRVSETQLQVGENSNWIIWRVKGQCKHSMVSSFYLKHILKVLYILDHRDFAIKHVVFHLTKINNGMLTCHTCYNIYLYIILRVCIFSLTGLKSLGDADSCLAQKERCAPNYSHMWRQHYKRPTDRRTSRTPDISTKKHRSCMLTYFTSFILSANALIWQSIEVIYILLLQIDCDSCRSHKTRDMKV